jgi:hypothetical protein
MKTAKNRHKKSPPFGWTLILSFNYLNNTVNSQGITRIKQVVV